MKDEYDFSNAERGKFYLPDERLAVDQTRSYQA